MSLVRLPTRETSSLYVEAETVRQLSKGDLLDHVVLLVHPLNALLGHEHLQQGVQAHGAQSLAWERQGNVVKC